MFVGDAFHLDAEEAFGHFVAPGVEHGDDGLGVGLPGHRDAVFDFEADFLAGELEFAHGVAHERFDAEIFGDFRVERCPVAAFFGDREFLVGEGLHDDEVGRDFDRAGTDGERDGFTGAGFGDDEVFVGREGGTDFLDGFAEFGACGAEVELDFVIERAGRARGEDFDDFDVEVVFEDVLEALRGFEADFVGGAEDHFAQRLTDLEFLGFAGAEGRRLRRGAFCRRSVFWFYFVARAMAAPYAHALRLCLRHTAPLGGYLIRRRCHYQVISNKKSRILRCRMPFRLISNSSMEITYLG